MAEKKCTKCGLDKQPSEFAKDASKKDGLYSSCKDCTKFYLRESQLEAARRWRFKNPEKMRAIKRHYYDRNLRRKRKPKDPTAPMRAKKNWKRKNPDRVRADRAQRRAIEVRALPSWADLDAIRGMYAEARAMEAMTGESHHVDHIVPLRSPLVCGLHWHGNLQLLKSVENLMKSNRYWPGINGLERGAALLITCVSQFRNGEFSGSPCVLPSFYCACSPGAAITHVGLTVTRNTP